MASLTVRAFAELISMPVHQYVRFLYQQKYPRQQPQTFRTPYYSAVLTAIRNYYREDRDPAVLVTARGTIGLIRNDTRRESNMRALRAFENSRRQRRRNLQVLANPRLVATVHELELRLSLDMSATERDRAKPLYYNCRTNPLDTELARTTVEIAHWVLQENAITVPHNAPEYIDLTANRVHRAQQRRTGTIRRMHDAARVVQALWPTI